jgi:hypothetical protein
MNEAQIAKMAKWKLLGHSSCADCKFLYLQDDGYSNWTVEDTQVVCALDKNPELPASMPYDWEWGSDGQDNWPKTNRGRCDRYDQRAGDWVHLDVDGEARVEDYTSDPEVIAAIRDDI